MKKTLLLLTLPALLSATIAGSKASCVSNNNNNIEYSQKFRSSEYTTIIDKPVIWTNFSTLVSDMNSSSSFSYSKFMAQQQLYFNVVAEPDAPHNYVDFYINIDFLNNNQTPIIGSIGDRITLNVVLATTWESFLVKDSSLEEYTITKGIKAFTLTDVTSGVPIDFYHYTISFVVGENWNGISSFISLKIHQNKVTFANYLNHKDELWTTFVNKLNDFYFKAFDGHGYAVNSLLNHVKIESKALTDGGTKSIYVELGSGITLQTILNEISAADIFGKPCDVVMINDRDEVLSSEELSRDITTVYDDFISQKIRATDEYNNTAIATLNIYVVDNKSPILSLKNEAFTNLIAKGKLYSKSELIGMMLDRVLITDADSRFTYELSYSYDNNTFIPLTNSITVDKESNSFSLRLTVTDRSANSSSIDISFVCSDLTAPVISLKTEYAGIEKLMFNYSNKIIDEDILEYFEAIDEIDGKVALSLSNFNASQIGVQTVTISARDSSNNVGTLNFNVEIVQDVPPFFVLSNKLLICSSQNPISIDELSKLILAANGVKSSEVISFSIDNAEVVGKQLYRVGTYEVTYNLVSSKITKSDSIKVSVVSKKQANKSFFEKIGSWFYNYLIKPVKEFFVRLGNFITGKGWKL